MSAAWCPICGSKLVYDGERGEICCSVCGYVVQEKTGVTLPKLVRDSRGRFEQTGVSSISTYLRKDRGLSTSISPHFLGPQAKALLKTEKVVKSSEGRTLEGVLKEVEKIAQKLVLPRAVKEKAAYYIHTLDIFGIARNRSHTLIASAVIYMTLRELSISRTMKEVASVSDVDPRQLMAVYKKILLMNDLSIKPIPIKKYISRFVGELGASVKVERVAMELYEKIGGCNLPKGKSPLSITASLIYVASMLCGDPISQEEVCKVAKIREVTLRNRVKEIFERNDVNVIINPLANNK